MASKIGLAVFLTLLTWPVAAAADIINVPGEQPTIQAGIDAADSGDVVLVADGTYTGSGNRDLDFGGKAITVRSENGPAACVIDCQGTEEDPHRGVYFQSGEGKDTVLEGFTITNGAWESFGGAIACWNDSSPTITGNILSGNSTDFRGGAIDCFNASPVIVNNTITGNTADFFGSGIYCEESSALILNNVISGNIDASSGGGIYCEYAPPDIIHNTITGNTVQNSGGGLYCWGSSPLIAYNSITDNTAGNYGGAVYCFEDAYPIIVNNTISGNTATNQNGGGIYCYENGSPVIVNNLIVDNSANNYGGGICCRSSSPVIISSTISGNSAVTGGGGIYSYLNSSPLITNTIFWGNSAAAGKEIYVGTSSFPSSLTISYSDVDGGQSLVQVDTNCTLNWGVGMFNSDPFFTTGPLGDYYLSRISTGNGSDSPCLDTGDKVVGFTPENSFLPIGTTATDHQLDSGILDVGYHYSIIGIAMAGGPYSGRVGREITFDASGSFDPYGSITGYRWDFENDGQWDTAWLSGPAASHIYSTAYEGQVRLQIMDNDGYTHTALADVEIVPPVVKVQHWLETAP